MTLWTKPACVAEVYKLWDNLFLHFGKEEITRCAIRPQIWRNNYFRCINISRSTIWRLWLEIFAQFLHLRPTFTLALGFPNSIVMQTSLRALSFRCTLKITTWPTTGCSAWSTSVWVHKNLLLQLSGDGNLRHSDMSHAPTASPQPGWATPWSAEKISELIGVFSPVSYWGLYQGWRELLYRDT